MSMTARERLAGESFAEVLRRTTHTVTAPGVDGPMLSVSTPMPYLPENNPEPMTGR
jgi:hypothetical protein